MKRHYGHTDGHMDRQMVGHTDRQTDRPSYRDAMPHLKISPFQAQIYLESSYFNFRCVAQIGKVFKLIYLKQMEKLYNHSKI